MLRKKNCPAGKIFFRLFSLIFLLTIQIYPQAKTNLQIFYQLIDSSASLVSLNFTSNKIKAELNFPGNFGVFNNQFIIGMEKRGKNLSDSSSESAELNYVLENAEVNYGEMFRSSFLGDYLIERSITINGNFLVKNSSNEEKNSWKSFPFNLAYYDSVKADNLKRLENPQFPFTHDEIPAEPFFSSIWIPVIAVTTAATAIYLFFSIRSK